MHLSRNALPSVLALVLVVVALFAQPGHALACVSANFSGFCAAQVDYPLADSLNVTEAQAHALHEYNTHSCNNLDPTHIICAKWFPKCDPATNTTRQVCRAQCRSYTRDCQLNDLSCSTPTAWGDANCFNATLDKPSGCKAPQGASFCTHITHNVSSTVNVALSDSRAQSLYNSIVSGACMDEEGRTQLKNVLCWAHLQPCSTPGQGGTPPCTSSCISANQRCLGPTQGSSCPLPSHLFADAGQTCATVTQPAPVCRLVQPTFCDMVNYTVVPQLDAATLDSQAQTTYNGLTAVLPSNAPQQCRTTFKFLACAAFFPLCNTTTNGTLVRPCQTLCASTASYCGIPSFLNPCTLISAQLANPPSCFDHLPSLPAPTPFPLPSPSLGPLPPTPTPQCRALPTNLQTCTMLGYSTTINPLQAQAIDATVGAAKTASGCSSAEFEAFHCGRSIPKCQNGQDLPMCLSQCLRYKAVCADVVTQCTGLPLFNCYTVDPKNPDNSPTPSPTSPASSAANDDAATEAKRQAQAKAIQDMEIGFGIGGAGLALVAGVVFLRRRGWFRITPRHSREVQRGMGEDQLEQFQELDEDEEEQEEEAFQVYSNRA